MPGRANFGGGPFREEIENGDQFSKLLQRQSRLLSKTLDQGFLQKFQKRKAQETHLLTIFQFGKNLGVDIYKDMVQ